MPWPSVPGDFQDDPAPFAGTGEPIAYVQDGIHVWANSAYLALLGFAQAEELLDTPFLDLVEPSSHDGIRGALKRLNRGDPAVRVDGVCLVGNGVRLQAALTLSRDSLEGEAVFRVLIRPISEWEPAPLGQPEPLLSLPDRDQFMAHLVHWQGASSAMEGIGALLLISLDGNLANPHEKPDPGSFESCANLLRQGITPDDLLARYNENGFALLCRRPLARDLEQLADALRRRLETGTQGGQGAGVTCTIGMVLLGGTQDAAQLLDQARHACAQAHNRGGNQVFLASPFWEGDVHGQDPALLQEIDAALETDRFRLAYQPIVSLQGDTREHYGVLVRMLDANDEEWLPEPFLRQAEQAGKLPDIDRWVMRHAIAALSEHRRQGRKLGFFLTVSRPSLADGSLLLWICECLRDYQARGGWLTFQIRERYVRDQPREALRLIDGLKKINCQIALDHFGLLPRPEDLLDQLPLDFVKLAPSFAERLASDQRKQDLLNEMHQLILSRGIQTIATAVEDANSLTVLWTLGIGYIQGNFLQEPSLSIAYPAAPRG